MLGSVKVTVHFSPHIFLDLLPFFSQRITYFSWGNNLSLLLLNSFYIHIYINHVKGVCLLEGPVPIAESMRMTGHCQPPGLPQTVLQRRLKREKAPLPRGQAFSRDIYHMMCGKSTVPVLCVKDSPPNEAAFPIPSL